MNQAQRQRQYRERRAAGVIAVTVMVFEVDLAQALIDAGKLPASKEDDRTALGEAIEAHLADIANRQPDDLPSARRRPPPRQVIMGNSHIDRRRR